MKPQSEEQILKDLGKRFKAVRKQYNLTQESFDVDSSTIRRIETGKINPSYILLRKISASFKMTLAELLLEIEKVK